MTDPSEGTGFNYSIDSGTTWSATSTFTGLAPGGYNVTVMQTATGCVSPIVSLTVNPVPAVPAAPTASVTQQPTCTVPTGTVTVTDPIGSSYEYSIDGSAYQSSATFTGLNPNTYPLTVRSLSDPTCVSAPASLTVNSVPGAPALPTASVTQQPTCAVTTGTVTVTDPSEGTGFNYSIDSGTTWSATSTFTGLAPGGYNVTVMQTATGCVSPIVSLTVNPVPAVPAAPTASVTQQPTCALTTGTVTVTDPSEGTGFNYSIDSGTTWSATSTFTGLAPGGYNVTVMQTATGCVSPIVSLTVNPVPAVPVAPTASVTQQPTCTVPTGTITVTDPIGPSYEYSIDGSAYQSSATFTGLNPNTYPLTVRSLSDPTCVFAPASLTVNSVPGAPDLPTASVTQQPTCAVTTGTVTVTDPSEGTGFNYSIDSGTTWSATSTFTGLAPGGYNVTVMQTATGCVSPIVSLTVNPVPVVPAAPTASVTQQPTCTVPTGTVTVTDPIGPSYEYSIDGSAYQSSATFTGLNPNTYPLTVRSLSDPTCVSAPASLTVNSVPGAPALPTASVTQQPTCAVTTGTVTVTDPSEGTGFNYSIDSGTTWSATSTFTGLAPGSYSVGVQETATGCVSPIVSLTVNPVPAVPAAPTASVTQQPTCTVPTGTITVTDPIGPSYEYSIDGSAYQSSATFTGLNPNTYPLTVRSLSDPTCVSAPASLTVNAVPGAPALPTASVTQQPTCALTTGTVTVTDPSEGTGFNYSIDSGTTWSATSTFTGLAPGGYNVTVMQTATGCVSPIVSLTVNPVPAVPAAPTASVTQQPTCTVPTGTVTVTDPIGPSYEYSIDGSAYQSSATFTGLNPNTYPLTVRSLSDPTCVSAPASLTVNSVPGTPRTCRRQALPSSLHAPLQQVLSR